MTPRIKFPLPALRTCWRAALLGWTLCGLLASAPGAERPRNVVILLADDYGAMDYGAANPDTFYETPNLDRLARQGVRLTSGYAASPVCSPTRFSVMTGRYPTRVGVTNFLYGQRVERFLPAPLERAMPLEEVTLAEALKARGYRTAFVGKWHLGETEEYWPEAQGFDFNVAGFARGAPNSWFSPYKNPRIKDGPPGEFLTERLASESVALLERFHREGKPFLLCHSFYQVHTPLRAPEPLVEKYRAKAQRLGLEDTFARERQHFVSDQGPRRVRTVQSHPVYAAMVESMDTAVGRILRRLEELGMAEDTLVIFTSDNGGLSTSEGLPTSNLPLRGGKGWLYEGGIRVPWIVRLPGAPAGAVDDMPVMTTDIFPSALEFAGVAVPAGVRLDGRSFLGRLRGGAAMERPLFWHYPHYSNQGGFPGGAIRLGDWKLIENYEDGAVMLYNLREDLAEKKDLAAEQPARVRELRSRLHAWYRETGAKFLQPQPKGPAPWQPGQ